VSDDPVRAIADAVLYEGYILWPYRRSALKNQRRWTFGGVHPRGHWRGHEDDRWLIRTQVLVEAEAHAELGVRVRFLHVVRRQVAQQTPAGLEPVEELEVGGERHLSWEEATEREVSFPPTRLDGLSAGRSIPISIPAGSEAEELREAGSSVPAGVVLRSWEELEGSLTVRAERLREDLYRLTMTVANTTPWEGGTREGALKQTFCSAHGILHCPAGRFVSLTDPPDDLRKDAGQCGNDGVWPVLVGEPEERQTMLVSPIILPDHPRVADESPGDLFDGGEIDQLLTLNILALTEEEKEEMRRTDPRAREILERTEALSGEELLRLHGTIRELRLAREPR
jgi:hydrogenase maturation protease